LGGMLLGTLVLAATSVVVQVEESRGIDEATSAEIAATAVDLLRNRSDLEVVLDEGNHGDCADRMSCIVAALTRTGADQLLLMRFFAGPTKLRMVLERVDHEGPAGLPRDRTASRDSWRPALGELIEALYPKPKEAVFIAGPVASKEPDGAPLVPLVVAVSGLVAIGVGIAFASSASSAASDLSSAPQKNELASDLLGRADAHATLANIFVFTGLASVAAGVTLGLVEE